MKSFFIKTNNNQIIEHLLKSISQINLNNVYYSNQKFDLYNNVILHYTGEKVDLFITKLSEILADCIILFYENRITKRILNFNYFYFDSFEKDIIYKDCINTLKEENISNYSYRKDSIIDSVYSYICENRTMILSGFVNFRLPDYIKSIDTTVDIAVNKFVLEKEYKEFVELLKLYINSKNPNVEMVHLVYLSKDSILLDENKNILSIPDNIFNAKYLSDISFSSNDYVLNTLIDLLPRKIIVHLISPEDDFIKTLKIIFENRINICLDCNICKTYSLLDQNFSTITNRIK